SLRGKLFRPANYAFARNRSYRSSRQRFSHANCGRTNQRAGKTARFRNHSELLRYLRTGSRTAQHQAENEARVAFESRSAEHRRNRLRRRNRAGAGRVQWVWAGGGRVWQTLRRILRRRGDQHISWGRRVAGRVQAGSAVLLSGDGKRSVAAMACGKEFIY